MHSWGCAAASLGRPACTRSNPGPSPGAAPPAAGGSLLAAALTRSSVRRALAVAARFGLAGGYAALFLHSAELYPAVVRAQVRGRGCGRPQRVTFAWPRLHSAAGEEPSP